MKARTTALIDDTARLLVERADLYRDRKCGVIHLCGAIDTLIKVVISEVENGSISAQEQAVELGAQRKEHTLTSVSDAPLERLTEKWRRQQETIGLLQEEIARLKASPPPSVAQARENPLAHPPESAKIAKDLA